MARVDTVAPVRKIPWAEGRGNPGALVRAGCLYGHLGERHRLPAGVRTSLGETLAQREK